VSSQAMLIAERTVPVWVPFATAASFETPKSLSDQPTPSDSRLPLWMTVS